MPDREEESLGMEQLPQTELDFVPGAGEEATSEAEPDDDFVAEQAKAAQAERDRNDP